MEKEKILEVFKLHDQTFKDSGFSTKCLHIGQEPDIANGAVNVPIHLSTTFAQVSPGEPIGHYDYSRTGNPTRHHLERLICGIENSEHALVWSSGMAATTGVLHLLKCGDEVVCIDDVYGGTQRYFKRISNTQHNTVFNFIPFDDFEILQKTLSEKTKMIWFESPTNPTLKTVDIGKVVSIVKKFNPEIIIVCDNTFMSPYNCRPLELGVDIVVESATKYIGGHSDIVMGISATNNKDFQERLYFIHKSTGGVPSPFDCFMAIRGVKTLSIRVERQNYNTLRIAEFLETHEMVEKVLYPGLKSSPYHEVAKKQQKGFGGVLSFIIKGSLEDSVLFLKSLKVFVLAESLGSVESLAEHPALMTHASVPGDIRKELGIEDSFIRIAVGIEDVEDLIKDLDDALNKLKK
jgi:cystathionine gamma-lyase